MTTPPAALPSVFEILKPAVGPSSSHTLGPMLAAQTFLKKAAQPAAAMGAGARIRVTLYGSLALTGRGHLTNAAIAAGLAGFGPRDLSGTSLAEIRERVRSAGRIQRDDVEFLFDPDRDIVFDGETRDLPHPNTMTFSLVDGDGTVHLTETYYSIGGGRLAGGAFGALVARNEERGRISASSILAKCAREKMDLTEYVYRAEATAWGRTRTPAARIACR